MRSAAIPPCLILCAGLKSSGSTWLYNAVLQLIEAATRGGTKEACLPFYADSLGDFPPAAKRAATLIVKTHRPSRSIELLTRILRGKVLITVREPRDAIASLMQRFHHRFETCLGEVTINANRTVDISAEGDPLILRYEDRFCDRQETLDLIAHHLNLSVSEAAKRKIFLSLAAPNIQRRIRSMAARGAFGRAPTADSFDPKTHWHPGHIGDRLIGKYESILTPAMQREISTAMRDYCAVFGYPTALTPASKPKSRKRKSKRRRP